MNSSKTALVINQIIEKVQLVAGIIILLLFGLCTIMSLYDHELGAGGFLQFCLVCDVIGLVLIIFSRKRRKLTVDFKKYVTALSGNETGNIDYLAAALNTSPDIVKSNIEKMIKKNLFANAYIDANSNRLVIGGKSQAAAQSRPVPPVINQAPVQQKIEYMTVNCKGCGGVNKVARGAVTECEYCGSMIKGE